jgi:orotate phosphoribosyltransferase
MSSYEKLINLIKKYAYKEGEFILSSGVKSNFYLDVKNLSLHPDGALEICELICSQIDFSEFQAIGGPTLGADPIVCSLGIFLKIKKNISLPCFLIRKEPKKYGRSLYIEGVENIPKNSKVLIIEDVVTTGLTSLQAIEKVRNEGFVVDTLLCVVDRLCGAKDLLNQNGVQLKSLTTIEQIQNFS